MCDNLYRLYYCVVIFLSDNLVDKAKVEELEGKAYDLEQMVSVCVNAVLCDNDVYSYNERKELAMMLRSN